MLPILQMRKLRLRETEQLPPADRAGVWTGVWLRSWEPLHCRSMHEYIGYCQLSALGEQRPSANFSWYPSTQVGPWQRSVGVYGTAL